MHMWQMVYIIGMLSIKQLRFMMTSLNFSDHINTLMAKKATSPLKYFILFSLSFFSW